MRFSVLGLWAIIVLAADPPLSLAVSTKKDGSATFYGIEDRKSHARRDAIAGIGDTGSAAMPQPSGVNLMSIQAPDSIIRKPLANAALCRKR